MPDWMDGKKDGNAFAFAFAVAGVTPTKFRSRRRGRWSSRQWLAIFIKALFTNWLTNSQTLADYIDYFSLILGFLVGWLANWPASRLTG